MGQSENFLIPKIVTHFRRREPVIRLGNLDVEREFNDVRMVAQAYLGLLEKAGAGEVVNICSGQGWRLRDIVDCLTHMSGHGIDIEVDPILIRANEVRQLIGNSEKLRTLIGSPPTFSLKETLNWMLCVDN